MLSSRVLGTTITKEITQRATAPLLVVGSDRVSRHAFSAVDFYSPIAAANLSRAIAQFRVRNLRDVFDKVPPQQLLLPGLGAWSIAALGAAFELAKIGGESPLESWFQRHADKDDKRPIVTVSTIKAHQKAAPTTRRRRRQKAIERETRATRSNGNSATTKD